MERELGEQLKDRGVVEDERKAGSHVIEVIFGGDQHSHAPALRVRLAVFRPTHPSSELLSNYIK